MASRTLPNLGLKAFYDLGEDGWKAEQDLGILKLSVLAQAGAASKVSATPGAPTEGDVHIFDGTHPTNANDIAIYDDSTWKYVTPNEGWLVYNRAENYFELFDGSAWAEFTTGGGGDVAVEDDGTEVLAAASRLNFTGAGVTATDSGSGEVEIAIPGGSGGGSETITEATTSANLANADAGKYQRWTATGAKTLTVQPNTTEAITQDAEFHLRNAAASDNLTISAGSGVTINAPSGGTLVLSPGMVATLKRVAEDEFDLIGQTVAV